MVMIGEVISGEDKIGNCFVKPLKGGREVVLRGSNGKYQVGQHVFYEVVELGSSRDFSSRTHKLVSNEELELEKRKIFRQLPEINENQIKSALSTYRQEGIQAVILYDSDKRLIHHTPIAIVSTCAGRVSRAVSLVHEYAESGTFRFGEFFYQGLNGLYGERMLVKGTGLLNSFNEGSNWVRRHYFISVPGLSSGDTWETVHISPKTLQYCVENTRLERMAKPDSRRTMIVN